MIKIINRLNHIKIINVNDCHHPTQMGRVELGLVQHLNDMINHYQYHPHHVFVGILDDFDKSETSRLV